MYYKNADAIVLIYDVTDRQSYLDIYNYWIPEIESFGETDVIFFIVGNKIDLSSKLVEMNEVNQDIFIVYIGASRSSQLDETFFNKFGFKPLWHDRARRYLHWKANHIYIVRRVRLSR